MLEARKTGQRGWHFSRLSRSILERGVSVYDPVTIE
jgi:hypothetical protein